MFKIIALLAVASLSVAAPAQASIPATTVKIQKPCVEKGHDWEMACVVATKTISGQTAVIDDTVDTSAANSLRGYSENFSIIYKYRIAPSAANKSVVVRLRSGTKVGQYRVNAGRPASLWVSTGTSGKAWSKILTPDTDLSIPY